MIKGRILKNNKVRILIIIEILLLLFGLVGLVRGNRIELSDKEMNLSLLEGEYIEGKGYVIDQTSGYSGTYILSESFELKPGVYELQIHYSKTGEDIASAMLLNGNSTFYGYRASLSNLFMEDNINKSQFYVLEKSDSFQIAVNFAGTDEMIVSDIEVIHTNTGSRMFLFALILLSIMINGLVWIYFYLQENQVAIEKKVTWIAIPIIAILPSIPLFTDYTIIGTDTLFYLKRIEIVGHQILEGSWSAKSIFLTIPALFRLIGFPMLFSYGMYVFMINFISTFIAFYVLKKCFDKSYIALLGSAVYMLSPYRINLIYKLGDIGTMVELLLVPILIFAFVRLFQKKNVRFILGIFGMTIVTFGLYVVFNGTDSLARIKEDITSLISINRIESWNSIRNIGLTLILGSIIFLVLCLLQKKEHFTLKKEINIAALTAMILGSVSLLINFRFLGFVSYIIPTLLVTRILLEVYDEKVLNVYIIMTLTILVILTLYQTNSILLTTSNADFIRGYTLDARGYKENVEIWYSNPLFVKSTCVLSIYSLWGLFTLIIRCIGKGIRLFDKGER